MVSKIKIQMISLFCMLMIFSNVKAQDSGKISGYMFGDYYYVAKNHSKKIEGDNGFWFRRIYITYDRKLSKEFKIRFRMELNSPGDFKTKDKLKPAAKDAYLKWTRNNHSIIFGISPTPTWDVIEKIWGYRSVVKTPLDLQKFGSSRDFGIVFKGALDSGKKLSYHLMIANGNSNSSEVGGGKKVLFSLTARPGGGVVLEAYADADDRKGGKRRYTLQGFAGVEGKKSRIGLQFARQARRNGPSADDTILQILSVFGTAQLSHKTWLFARLDRTFDPNPDGAKISYIPFAPNAESTFIVTGLDFRPIKDVHIMPNVELVLYGGTDSGVTPDSDIIPRLTWYYKF